MRAGAGCVRCRGGVGGGGAHVHPHTQCSALSPRAVLKSARLHSACALAPPTPPRPTLITLTHLRQAYFKMNNVLIDDRRIKVDFSQSVSHLWKQFKRHGRKGNAEMAGEAEGHQRPSADAGARRRREGQPQGLLPLQWRCQCGPAPSASPVQAHRAALRSKTGSFPWAAAGAAAAAATTAAVGAAAAGTAWCLATRRRSRGEGRRHPRCAQGQACAFVDAAPYWQCMLHATGLKHRALCVPLCRLVGLRHHAESSSSSSSAGASERSGGNGAAAGRAVKTTKSARSGAAAGLAAKSASSGAAACHAAESARSGAAACHAAENARSGGARIGAPRSSGVSAATSAAGGSRTRYSCSRA